MNTPSITTVGPRIRLEWPDMVVLAYRRESEVEVGQFATKGLETRAEVETLVRAALHGH